MSLRSLRLKLALLGLGVFAFPGISQAQFFMPWMSPMPVPVPANAAGVDRGQHRAPLFGWTAPYASVPPGGAANADLVYQQANLLRQEVYRSRAETRKAVFDERRYYRANTPTYEQQRQESLRDRLSQAVNNPPASAIRSGAALNDVAAIIRETETSTGVRGPQIELSRDAVEHINWTTAEGTPGLAMVKNGSEGLRWPATLESARFSLHRQEIARMLDEAVSAARDRSPKARELATRISDEIDRMREDLRELRDAEEPQAYVDAVGFLRELGEASARLKDRGAFRVLTERIQAATVGELVDQMTARGLRIGAAAPGDESYYNALYDALASYERGLNRMVKNGSGSSSVGRR